MGILCRSKNPKKLYIPISIAAKYESEKILIVLYVPSILYGLNEQVLNIVWEKAALSYFYVHIKGP